MLLITKVDTILRGGVTKQQTVGEQDKGQRNKNKLLVTTLKMQDLATELDHQIGMTLACCRLELKSLIRSIKNYK